MIMIMEIYTGTFNINYINDTQDDIDIGHDYLSNKIIQHSKLYRKYNGQLHILEKREKRPYTTQQIIENNLSWPNFDTAAQFL